MSSNSDQPQRRELIPQSLRCSIPLNAARPTMSGEQIRLSESISKCREILGDLEVTAVSLEQLLLENTWSKAAIDVEVKDLADLYENYTVAHLEVIRRCESLNLNTKPHHDRRQRFLTRYKQIRNQLLSHTSGSHAMNSASDNGVNSGLRLPKVEIPTFDGNFEQWPGWYTLYESLIHNNASLQPMSKYSYLRSLLKDAPLTMIQGYPFEDAYYEAAFKAILDHYNDPLRRISRLLNQLQETPSVKEKKQSLRGLVSNFRAVATSLQILFQENTEIDPLSQLLIHDFLAKADKGTRQDWEREVMRRKSFATFSEFIEYMEGRCHAYERATAGSSSNTTSQPSLPSASRSNTKPKTSVLATTTKKPAKCYYCNQEHTIYKCSSFSALSVAERQKYVREKTWCGKCLSPKCNKRCNSYCRLCKKGHNLLLHDNRNDKSHEKTNPGKKLKTISNNVKINESEYVLTPESNFEQSLDIWIGNISHDFSEALLATAEIKIQNPISHSSKICKVLVDSASQSNLISRRLARELDLKPHSKGCNLGSIQGHSSVSGGCVEGRVIATHAQFQLLVNFEIVDEIVDAVPQESFSIDDWHIPKNLILADPNFNMSSEIEVLLGLRLFWKILGSKKIHLAKNLPCLRSSSLGWLVTDDRVKIPPSIITHKRIFAVQTLDTLSKTMQRFWLVDEFDNNILSLEEIECEQSFVQTSSRTLQENTGYFTVHLPFKINENKLGDSRTRALKQFYALEKRLMKKPEQHEEYAKGMNDYLIQRHMVEIQESLPKNINSISYYMPHHAVIKETSTSTKLRNVFNASSPSSSGLSLNDCLMVGPVIQSDLLTVLMRFRLHKIVFTADIKQMYRQVRLHPDFTKFQRVFWRNHPSEPLKVYEIVTLAFGTASAPFLATRCLKALVDLDGKLFPQACSALLHDFYVDDVLTGANSVQEALEIQSQLKEILLRGGFTLSKWGSNSPDLLLTIPESQKETSFPFSLEKDDKIIKTLGLLWSSTNDCYQIKVNLKNYTEARSKRHILSIVASIFDPLGFLSPVTVNAKLLIQSIWADTHLPRSPKSTEHWDEAISTSLKSDWLKFASNLHVLHDITVPRYLFINSFPPNRIELHGFADASQKAFGAVVYIRSINSSGSHSRIFFSKSKVAPIKTQTIPRLELCAAVLLSEIMDKVQTALKDLLNFDIIRLWSDSQVVLHWIASPPTKWLPFVANRVAKIQKMSNNCYWDYVNTKHNPADLISRGITPSDLKQSSLWWEGPEWLSQNKIFDTKIDFSVGSKSTDLEIRKSKKSLNFATVFKSSFFSRYSNYWKLNRSVAWVTRFILNASPVGPYLSGPLSLFELREATKTLVKLAQRETFSTELKRLKNGSEIKKTSPLVALSPFLDNDALIRVGGRLHESDLTYDQQHPFVLDPKHELSILIVRYYHEAHLHAGPQRLRAILRNQFWILKINSIIRSCILKCPKCVRMKADTRNQAMASLPKTRISPARPFTVSGIDYAGPFSIIGKGGRHKVLVKAYIAVFVCFSTKAIHLELVSDLTSSAFLAALSRFVARRGMPREIWSDNGTNFVGANTSLKKEFTEFLKSYADSIMSFATERGCEWHFIPPYSPHFGGIWEAGVKSVKGQLKFVMANNAFTFEQWCTALAQIEACLNSRPIMVDSTDPNEPGALTPGHFLTGGPITSLPNPDLTSIPSNRLKHWETVKAQTQKFWKRWRNEYLNTLQQKSKWKFAKDSVKINDIVIIKDDHSPPTFWPLGKIVQVHPGADGLIRVASIQTLDSEKEKPIIIKRPIVKLILLPVYE